MEGGNEIDWRILIEEEKEKIKESEERCLRVGNGIDVLGRSERV